MKSDFNKMLEFMQQDMGIKGHKCGIAIGSINSSNIQIINENSDSLFISPFGMEIFCGMILLNGRVSLTADYNEYNIVPGSIFIKGSRTIITSLTFSNDAEAIFYICTQTFMEECVIDKITSIMNKIITVQPRNLYRLSEEENKKLLTALSSAQWQIEEKPHEIQVDLIKSCFLTFFLEIIRVVIEHSKEDCISGDNESKNAASSASQAIIKRFITLLLEYGDTQHHPSFYADKLCISVQYLSLILKSVTKNTATRWIAGYTITRAKLYLRQPAYNIQQVASMLNFADQSSFGKFFRKHTGISPKSYREHLGSNNQ